MQSQYAEAQQALLDQKTLISQLEADLARVRPFLPPRTEGEVTFPKGERRGKQTDKDRKRKGERERGERKEICRLYLLSRVKQVPLT